jgi:hypothetical protein
LAFKGDPVTQPSSAYGQVPLGWHTPRQIGRPTPLSPRFAPPFRKRGKFLFDVDHEIDRFDFQAEGDPVVRFEPKDERAAG